MPKSPEGGLQIDQNPKNKHAFIRLDLNNTTSADFTKLEELGWKKGLVDHGGDIVFFWEKDEEPELPDELTDKVIGTKQGKIEFTQEFNQIEKE